MRLKIKISDASNSSVFGLWYFDASKISDWSFQDYNNNTQYLESKKMLQNATCKYFSTKENTDFSISSMVVKMQRMKEYLL